MNRRIKFLSVVLAAVLSLSTMAFFACSDKKGQTKEINLEELINYAELFMASENYSYEFKVAGDFSGDLEKINLVEDMEQDFFVGIKRFEGVVTVSVSFLNTEGEIYSDSYSSGGTYWTNMQGERTPELDAADTSRTLRLGQDCYWYDNFNESFVKYEDGVFANTGTQMEYFCLMLTIADNYVNGNNEISKQFMDAHRDVIPEYVYKGVYNSLTEALQRAFVISPEDVAESVKVKLTGSELTITASATCNHKAQSADDGNYNLYYEIEAKFNYTAGLTAGYFESLISD